jgi:AcrR family transcriptional regulator
VRGAPGKRSGARSEPKASAAEPGRRERKKAETRARIYRTALRLVRRRGFDAVTVDEICTAADVAKRTFFLHFPTKHALVHEYGAQVRRLVREALAAETGGAEAKLRSALHAMAGSDRRNAEIVRLTVDEAFGGPHSGDVLEGGRTLALELAEVVRDGQKAGELRRGLEPRIVSAAIVATYLALVSEWARFGGSAPEVAIDALLDVILRGARVPEARAVRRS